MMQNWAVLPARDAWPYSLKTLINIQSPASVILNGTTINSFIAESPSQLCAPVRTSTLRAVQKAINMSASYVTCYHWDDSDSVMYRTISIAVRDYLPGYEYASSHHYWSTIDDAIRNAAYAYVPIEM